MINMDIEMMMTMQQKLMDTVPHKVRLDAYSRELIAISVINELIRFINASGRKPWRPAPLDNQKQNEILLRAQFYMNNLTSFHNASFIPSDQYEDSLLVRLTTATVSSIEEDLEFREDCSQLLNQHGEAVDKAEQRLEEIADKFFFIMEQMILTDIKPEDVQRKYVEKWQINMNRYAALEKGDTSWDDRNTKETL
jgi:phosphoribosyl-ATP pyrophosphohydrolase